MYTVKDIAEFIKGELKGRPEEEIKGVSALEDAEKGDIAFIENPALKDKVNTSAASCIITSFDLEAPNKSVIKCKNPSLAAARIVEKIFPYDVKRPKGVDKRAVLGDNVKLGRDVAIGANSVIGDNVSIGEGSVIYPLVYIGSDSKIGRNTVIYPNVTVRERIEIGDGVIIHPSAVIGSDGFGFIRDGDGFVKIPQTGIVEIRDDVEIGSGVTIDRARFGKTVVGKGSKIDNLVQIAHNVKIGANCIIVAQAGVSGSVKIGDNVMLGGQVGIRDHVEIGSGAMIAAKAGVSKSVPPKVIMSGIPARRHNITKRLIAHIDGLPKIVERLNALEKKVKGL